MRSRIEAFVVEPRNHLARIAAINFPGIAEGANQTHESKNCKKSREDISPEFRWVNPSTGAPFRLKVRRTPHQYWNISILQEAAFDFFLLKILDAKIGKKIV